MTRTRAGVRRPSRAYLPPMFETRRAWGFALNLYALRSARNWGIGDFSDLRAFVRFAAEAGADVVGLNPLHALHETQPEAASPYAPSSRYFLNSLYIDVTACAEFSAASEAARLLRSRVAAASFRTTLGELRNAAYVDYARVARLKRAALEACYAIFEETRGPRRDAFDRFVARGGRRLESFARFQALGAWFARQGTSGGWPRWPAAYRDAQSESVQAFAAQERKRIDYFKYVQFLAEEQLGAAAREAQRLALGLYLDVAVGADAGGADVWAERAAYVLDETVGAPPDAFNPVGQNWGLPPLHPEAMLRNGAADFGELLAANMTHAGALRLDHAMALLRLFRIPRGKPPADGAYVDYPFEELLADAAEQSERARCLIVGEDLGNVPAGFRERMERGRIFSYRLLLFERGGQGRFIAPDAYPALALATATTHDLPTLCGWALGGDIGIRERLDLLSQDAAQRWRDARRNDVALLLEALHAQGELGTENDARLCLRDARHPHDLAPLVRAAYRFLARSRARLVLVQLDDALGELDQINVPGTHGEYPNWRRKNALGVEEIACNAQIAGLAGDVRERVNTMPESYA